MMLVLFLVVFSLASFPNRHWLGFSLDDVNPNPLTENYFTQKVSHFDPSVTDTFQQRYFMNETFYQPGGPLFVLLGGEAPEDERVTQQGLIMINEYARLHNGLILDIECRFYGKSVPYGSLSVENYKYHTTPEILADYANVIQSIKDKFGCNGVITIGGSYSGCLSSWLHMKYPHLVNGALASSAPVEAHIDFSEYLDVVVSVLKQKFPTCLSNVEQGMNKAYDMLQQPETRVQLQRMFNVCEPLDPLKDQNLFFVDILGSMMGMVQYGQYEQLNGTCDLIDKAATPLEGIAKLFTSGGSCSDMSYQNYISQLKDETIWPSNQLASYRSWMWQKCTEFGFFHETKVGGPFPNMMTYDYLDGQCSDLFGQEYSKPGSDWINLMYGGYDPVNPNVFFTRGSADPWSFLASDMKNPNLLTFMIDGGSHCSDLFEWFEGEPEDIKVAQSKTVQYITQWLKG